MMRKRVVVIGGASQMFGAALAALLRSDAPLDFLLTDYRKEAVDAVKARHETSLPVECKFWNSMSGIWTIMWVGPDVPFA